MIERDTATRGRDKGLWLAETSPEELVFRQPLWFRAACGVAMLACIMGLCGYVNAAHHNLTAVVWFALLYSFPVLLLSWGAGPDTTRFDLRRRVYSYRMGFFWLTFRRQGSMDDLVGFHLTNGKKSSRNLWRLSVVREYAPPGSKDVRRLMDYPTLGEFGSRAQAERQAEELAARLGIPAKLVCD